MPLNIGAIIVARMSSTRLPAKMLRVICGRPLIDWVILRAQGMTTAGKLVVATSKDCADDKLARHCRAAGLAVYRGALDRLADRVAGCVEHHRFDYFVRINGDSPFLVPRLIDQGVHLATEQDLEFVTNLHPRSYPYGIAVEVFKATAFLSARQAFEHAGHQEHLSTYFYEHLQGFRHATITAESDFSGLRLTVDDQLDWNRAQTLIEALQPEFESADLQDILDACGRCLPAGASAAQG